MDKHERDFHISDVIGCGPSSSLSRAKRDNVHIHGCGCRNCARLDDTRLCDICFCVACICDVEYPSLFDKIED